MEEKPLNHLGVLFYLLFKQQVDLLELQLIQYISYDILNLKITSSYISENYPKAIEYIDRFGKITFIFLEFVN